MKTYSFTITDYINYDDEDVSPSYAPFRTLPLAVKNIPQMFPGLTAAAMRGRHLYVKGTNLDALKKAFMYALGVGEEYEDAVKNNTLDDALMSYDFNGYLTEE